MPGVFQGPRQETTSQTRTDPYAPAVPYVGGILNSLGQSYGIGPQGGGIPAGGIPGAGGFTLRDGSTVAMPAGGKSIGGGPPMNFNIGLSPEENATYEALLSNAQGANRFAPQITSLANDLFSGGGAQQNLDMYRTALQPYTTMSTDPFEDATFKRALGEIQNDAFDRVRSTSSFPGLGTYGQDVGEGVTRAALPFALQERARLQGLNRGAIDASYGAGNTSNQLGLANRQGGLGVGQAALAAENAPFLQDLALRSQQWGEPARRAATLAAPFFTAAQLGGTSNSTQQTQVHTPVGQQLLGAGLLGASMFTGGGPMAGLLGGMGMGAINPGIAGGGYLGPGGAVYPGPGWYG